MIKYTHKKRKIEGIRKKNRVKRVRHNNNINNEHETWEAVRTLYLEK